MAIFQMSSLKNKLAKPWQDRNTLHTMTTPTSPINALAHDLALVLSPLGDLCVGSPKASKLVDYPVDLEEAVIIIEQLKEENEKLKQENESYKVNQEQVQNQYMKLMCINNRLHSMIEQTKDETEKLKRENEALYKSSI